MGCGASALATEAGVQAAAFEELALAAADGDAARVEAVLDSCTDVVSAASADAAGRPALHVATLGGPACVEAFLRRGAPVDLADAHGSTALHVAAAAGLPGATAVLVSAGADVQRLNYTGLTPVAAAAEAGHANVVRLLLGAGADPRKGPPRARVAVAHVDDPECAALLAALDATPAADTVALGVPVGG